LKLELFASSICTALLLLSLSSRTLAQTDATAVVVLIGEANRTPELAGMLATLLLQQGVRAQFDKQRFFEPRSLLDAGTEDQRVWVFILLDGRLQARLYFRGPFGERFLLRELALRSGLDEVGRELIGRVVETSTLALLHSSEGLNRAQAEEGIAAAARAPQASGVSASQASGFGLRASGLQPEAPESADPARERETAREEPRASDVDRERSDDGLPKRTDDLDRADAHESWLLGARMLGQWTGNALEGRYGGGLELGHVLSHAEWPRVRLRAAFELNFSQTLERNAVDARVSTWPFRIGIDVGIARGMHAWLVGLSTGFDRVRTTAENARNAALRLAEPSTQLLAASRAELRYELTVSRLLVSVAALIDVPWAVTHYDVFQQGKRVRLGTPWQVRPGLMLGCGARL
jgi:hypothetical protein